MVKYFTFFVINVIVPGAKSIKDFAITDGAYVSSSNYIYLQT